MLPYTHFNIIKRFDDKENKEGKGKQTSNFPIIWIVIRIMDCNKYTSIFNIWILCSHCHFLLTSIMKGKKNL